MANERPLIVLTESERAANEKRGRFIIYFVVILFVALICGVFLGKYFTVVSESEQIVHATVTQAEISYQRGPVRELYLLDDENNSYCIYVDKDTFAKCYEGLEVTFTLITRANELGQTKQYIQFDDTKKWETK